MATAKVSDTGRAGAGASCSRWNTQTTGNAENSWRMMGLRQSRPWNVACIDREPEHRP